MFTIILILFSFPIPYNSDLLSLWGFLPQRQSHYWKSKTSINGGIKVLLILWMAIALPIRDTNITIAIVLFLCPYFICLSICYRCFLLVSFQKWPNSQSRLYICPKTMIIFVTVSNSHFNIMTKTMFLKKKFGQTQSIFINL